MTMEVSWQNEEGDGVVMNLSAFESLQKYN